MDVYWKNRKTDALGRNGWMQCIGLNIYISTDSNKGTEDIELTPINSKDDGGRCHIYIPVEDVPEVIKKLEKSYQTEKFFVRGET